MRRAVGVPSGPGLLVRAVADGGPATRAGLAEGDVLVAAGGAPLRSPGRLHALAGRAGAGRRLLELPAVRPGARGPVTAVVVGPRRPN